MKHNRFISLLLTVIFLFMYNTSYASAAEIKMINGVIQPMITIFNRQKLIECYTEEMSIIKQSLITLRQTKNVFRNSLPITSRN